MAEARKATGTAPAKKRNRNVGTFTQTQVDAIVEAAVSKALAAKPKPSQFLDWAKIAVVVVAWFAQMCFMAGFYGQRLNALEAAVHDQMANSMTANTIDAKFEEVQHVMKMQQDQLSDVQREVHELNGRK